MCDTCGDNISRGGKCSKTFTTSNLKKHMKLRHSPQFKEMEEQEKSREAEAMESCQENRSRGSQQVSLEFIVEKKKQFAFDHPKASDINKLVAEMIAVDDQPFSIVSDVGFTRLLNYLEPRYKLPSRKYFSETLIPDMYERVKLVVVQLLT